MPLEHGRTRSTPPTTSRSTAYNFRGADTSGGGYWTGFNDLGSGYKEVTVAGPQVYGLGADNHVYAINPGSARTDVGGYVASMALGGYAVDVAIGSDHSVYVDEQNPDGSWTGAIDLGGYVQSISSVKTSNGLPVVFGIDPDDGVCADEQTPFGDWTRLGGTRPASSWPTRSSAPWPPTASRK